MFFNFSISRNIEDNYLFEKSQFRFNCAASSDSLGFFSRKRNFVVACAILCFAQEMHINVSVGTCHD